jgi:hypothetical protein
MSHVVFIQMMLPPELWIDWVFPFIGDPYERSCLRSAIGFPWAERVCTNRPDIDRALGHRRLTYGIVGFVCCQLPITRPPPRQLSTRILVRMRPNLATSVNRYENVDYRYFYYKESSGDGSIRLYSYYEGRHARYIEEVNTGFIEKLDM